MGLIKKINNAPREMIKDRVLLTVVILSLWGLVNLLESMLPASLLIASPYPIHLYVLLLVVIVLATYTLLIFFAQKRVSKKRKPLPELAQYPAVDILIPAHNEESVIISTLENISQIDYSNYKIWVLDDRSNDRTIELVQEYIKDHPNVNLIERNQPERPGKAASLNYAMDYIEGEYFVIVDADARLQADALMLGLRYFYTESELGAVQFQKCISNYDQNLLTLCQDGEMAFDTYVQGGNNALNGMVELRGNGLIISRECLESLGGWHENSLTEDLELSTRMQINNWWIELAPEIRVQEEAVLTVNDLRKQRIRWAEGSLRRYLMHLKNFFSPKALLSLSQRFDIFSFLARFAIPVWLFLDLFTQGMHWILGEQTYFPLLTVGILGANLLVWLNIAFGIHYWRDYSFWRTMRLSIATHIYWSLLWPPISLYVIGRVILGHRPSTWVKTPRALQG